MPRIIQNFRRRYPDTDTIFRERSSNGSDQGTFNCLLVPTCRHTRKSPVSALGMIQSLVVCQNRLTCSAILQCKRTFRPLIYCPRTLQYPGNDLLCPVPNLFFLIRRHHRHLTYLPLTPYPPPHYFPDY